MTNIKKVVIEINILPKLQWLVILGILSASIYGTTYQQFRYFDLLKPGGASDSRSYIQMSHGDYRVTPIHRYRFIVPVVANTLRRVIRHFVHDQGEQDKLSFYIVNFACTLLTSCVLLKLMQYLGFSRPSSLLGAFIFISSRITILVTGTPLVDAPYFTAAVTIVYLTLCQRVWLLMVLLPLLMLTKETVLAIAMVPLLMPSYRRLSYGISLSASVALVFASRFYIDRIAGLGHGAYSQPSLSLFEVVMLHMKSGVEHILNIFTLSGMHDFQNGQSLFLLFALLGFLTNRRTAFMPNSPVLLALIPISLFYAVLSGNNGRMFFLTFPIVIPYAMVFIQDVLKFPMGKQTV